MSESEKKDTSSIINAMFKEGKLSWTPGFKGGLILDPVHSPPITRLIDEPIEIEFKLLHKDAVVPTKAHEWDAGFDLTATLELAPELYDGKVLNRVYETEVAVNIPKGYVGLLFPRSSISKKSLTLSNCVGVIDTGYQGSVKFKFRVINEQDWNSYKKGDRIGQLVILKLPEVTLKQVTEFKPSDRGTSGWGSSGS